MFEVKIKYTPCWRDPNFVRKQMRERRVRVVLGVFIALCFLCLSLPDGLRYDQAISIQLYEGGLSARVLFGCIFLTLTYMMSRLWMWGQRGASIGTGGMMAGLAVIVFTNPLSSLHLTTFTMVAAAIFLTQAFLFYRHSDGIMFLTMVVSFAGLLLCPFHIGIGERLLIASSCIGMHTMYYDHLDP